MPAPPTCEPCHRVEPVDDGTRRELLAAGAGLLVAGLAGCGDDEGAEAPADRRRVVRSKHGDQTISELGRVVTLDDQSTDDALALGVVPVGIADGTSIPGELSAWTRAALGKSAPTRIDAGEEIPFEAVAELRPDLILAVHNYALEERQVYRTLERIAPTVHHVEAPTDDPWQRTMRRIGTALDRRERADDLVAAAEAEIAEVRERGVLGGRTVTLFNADPGGVYAITDPATQAIRFLGQLGLRLSPDIEELNDAMGRGGVSPERYELLDADLVIGTAPTPDALHELERDRLFARIPAVRDGRFVRVPFSEITSIVFPSLLGVQHATRSLVPSLERPLA